MSDAALLTPTKPAVTPNRGLAQGQRQPTEQGAETAQGQGFSELLVEVEELALNGEQVVLPGLQAIDALRVALLENPQVQQALQAVQQQQLPTGVQADLIEAMPAIANGKSPRLVTSEQQLPTGVQGVQGVQGAQRAVAPLQHNIEGQVRREVVELRPLATAANTAARPVNPLETALQNPALMAEELQLTEQLRGTVAPKLETQIAATPRLEATLAQQAGHETSNPIVRQVATNLQFVARGEMERIRFDLHPAELGRVQVQLQKSGAVTRLTIVTETAQAFEALARGATGLQASLQQSGFDPDDLQFEHREGGSDQREAAEERRERREDARRESDPTERREVLVRPAVSAADQALFL